MKNAKEILEYVEELEKKNAEIARIAAVEFCETVVMKAIEAEAEKCNRNAYVKFPRTLVIDECICYLKKHNYKCFERTIGEDFISYSINW